MKLDEMHEEEFCVLVAPDGTPQVSTMAQDFPTCLAITKLLAMSGYGKHPEILLQEGFVILPIKVTIVQNGTEEDAFNMKPIEADL